MKNSTINVPVRRIHFSRHPNLRFRQNIPQTSSLLVVKTFAFRIVNPSLKHLLSLSSKHPFFQSSKPPFSMFKICFYLIKNLFAFHFNSSPKHLLSTLSKHLRFTSSIHHPNIGFMSTISLHSHSLFPSLTIVSHVEQN